MSMTTKESAEVDRNVEPDLATPKWSETRWHGCWNPDEGVGLYLHMGRFRHEVDLWWAQTVVYLPDGELIVDRSWGRQSDDRFVRTGVLELEQQSGGWACRFDGAGQLTRLGPLIEAPQGSAAPSVPVTWDVTAESVSPVWDLYGRNSEKEVFAGDSHIQQASLTTGRLTVAGKSYSLRGVGYKDHSSGTRTWDGYGAHNFLLAVMPGWTMHAITMYGSDGTARTVGAVFRDGRQIPVTRFDMDRLAELPDHRTSHPVTIELATGEVIELRAQRLHEVPITVADSGDNLTGVDWHAELPATVIQEAAATLSTTAGAVGYTFFERGVRRDAFRRAH
jgi:hypothetical protein